MSRGNVDNERWDKIISIYLQWKDKPKYANANAMRLYEDIGRKVFVSANTVWRALQRAGYLTPKAERKAQQETAEK